MEIIIPAAAEALAAFALAVVAVATLDTVDAVASFEIAIAASVSKGIL